MQTFDRDTTYPYGANVFKVCESEMLRVFEAKAKLKMLSNEIESETFLRYVKTKCESEKPKCMKLKKEKTQVAMYK